MSWLLFVLRSGRHIADTIACQQKSTVLSVEVEIRQQYHASSVQVVPYWGNTQDRRILRKFWSQENMHMKEASFHIVITSYQLIIQDIKYFQRIKWHYMILDEAQALKSSSRYTLLHYCVFVSTTEVGDS